MPISISIRGIVFSTLFGALLVVSSFLNVNLGFTPVPISLENMVVMLTGSILGPLYGFVSVMLVLILTAAGLPLLHGHGGLSVIFGATGGFLWAYPFAALLIGYLSGKVKGRGWKSIVLLFLIMELFGSLMLYIPGVPWLAHVAEFSMQKALVAGCYPYLAGDAAKALIAAFIVLPVRQAFPLSRILQSEGSRSAKTVTRTGSTKS